jgi:hypothetical protein
MTYRSFFKIFRLEEGLPPRAFSSEADAGSREENA